MNDPLDAMRAMRKEAREELERAEAEQTGGQEHASRAERAGVPEGGPPATAKGRGRGQS